MDQIDCFDGVNLLRRSGVNLLRRTGDNFSVFSTIDQYQLFEKKEKQ